MNSTLKKNIADDISERINNNLRICVVDDEKSIRDLLEISLRDQGYVVEICSSPVDALKAVKEKYFDAVITDISMPEMTGIELLSKVKGVNPDTVVIIITAFGSTESAVQAMRLGAADYLIKPFQLDELHIILERNLKMIQLERENRHLKHELEKEFSFDNIIGASKKINEVFKLIHQIAPTNTNVMVQGESGTGKELIAHAIHSNSERKGNPFITVNCGAIPETLMESEFFGHKKGSFTGAISDKKGLFQLAHNGTLFLDEIGEVPASIQVKLLRAIQSKIFRMVGGVEDIVVDVRIICATNRDLEKEVKTGNFREDLFYRLNVIQISMPSLRERIDDVPLLAKHFLAKHNLSMGKNINSIAKETLEILCSYDWPGNVRELENVIERAIALEHSEAISPVSLPPLLRERAVKVAGDKKQKEILSEVVNVDGQIDESVLEEFTAFDLSRKVEEVERRYIAQALDHAGGIKKKAAKLLGISFRSLRYRLEKYGINDPNPNENEEK